MSGIDYLPGQACVLHWPVTVSFDPLPLPLDKTHDKPPFEGEGLLHDLVLDNVPLPQVFAQVVFVHCPQLPLTNNEKE